MPRTRISARAIGVAVLAACCMLCLGCPPASIAPKTPVQRALCYLETHQVVAPGDRVPGKDDVVDYTGNWPQFFYFDIVPDIRIRDASPFIISYIHHALSGISEQSATTLGLSQSHIDAARRMRIQAMECMRRFESRPGDPDAGTFGFWPYERPTGPLYPDGAQFFLEIFRGPILGGQRVAINMPVYPSEMAIPSDADVTASVYASMLDDAILDGGPGARPFAHFFSDWRDLGAVPLRHTPSWLPPASGAFLTWLNYADTPPADFPSDVDLIVNANVLFTLGRYGALDTPGADDAIGLINFVVAHGLHRTRYEEVSIYYPDNFSFEYSVTRAYAEGHVSALEPAVMTLADELESRALPDGRGGLYWDLGSPHLNTAFAMLALINAGRSGEIVDRAHAYLIAEQDPIDGSWNEGPFFVARTDSGLEIFWTSTSFTTAMALEALCRHQDSN